MAASLKFVKINKFKAIKLPVIQEFELMLDFTVYVVDFW